MSRTRPGTADRDARAVPAAQWLLPRRHRATRVAPPAEQPSAEQPSADRASAEQLWTEQAWTAVSRPSAARRGCGSHPTCAVSTPARAARPVAWRRRRRAVAAARTRAATVPAHAAAVTTHAAPTHAAPTHAVLSRAPIPPVRSSRHGAAVCGPAEWSRPVAAVRAEHAGMIPGHDRRPPVDADVARRGARRRAERRVGVARLRVETPRVGDPLRSSKPGSTGGESRASTGVALPTGHMSMPLFEWWPLLMLLF